MPSLVQLQYLLAVLETGHFGRAAARSGVSQPTLSTQVQKAEESLGVTLFDRQAKPIRPTELGRPIIEAAREVVDAHERLRLLAADQSAELSGEFALGVIPTLAPYVLPWFLRPFANAHPRAELSVHERPTEEILAEIGHGRLDAAIVATPLNEPSIEERVLFYDPFYLYAHPDEPLLDRDEVEVSSLDAGKLWLLEDGHCFRTQVISFCGVQERLHLGSVRFAGGSFETLRHLIDTSEGYTLIPETYARTLPKASRRRNVRPFEPRTPIREVSLVHHRRCWKTPFFDALEKAIRATIPRALAQVDADGEILPVRERS